MIHKPGWNKNKTPREEVLLEGKPKWRGTRIIDEDGLWIHVPVDFVRAGKAISCTAFRILAVLKTYANEKRDIDKDGLEVWPSQKTIAADAGVSIHTCIRALSELKALGFLSVRKIGICRKGIAHNLYIIRKHPHSIASSKNSMCASSKFAHELD